ncbi:MAG: NINE protein [Verrucomicrobia bacterium]|nr:NINE protein [Verrucomicrobiota bacterium]
MADWIAQGRANGQTLAQAEAAADWKPLSQFPEFGEALAALLVPPRVASQDRRKSRLAAGVLGIVLGGLGVHRFYLGYVGIGIAQIVVTLCTAGVGALWGFIEGILILVGSTITTDYEGNPLKDP